ncbi:hypothetical protein DFQ26_000969 [Actinomortierella ambigua]|nr:hypothetical protein DFQ26_000969 [Actinomortierella ambigua]
MSRDPLVTSLLDFDFQAYRVRDQLGQNWAVWWLAFKAAYGYLEDDLVARKEPELLRIRD